MQQHNQNSTGYQTQTGENNTNFFGGEHHHQYPQPEAPLSGTPSNLPLSGVAKFVGREEALAAVGEQLQAATTVAISSVSGMGGVGKTELALQYAYQELAAEAYPGGICWINARVQDVGVAIVDFARIQLGLPEPPDTLETFVQQVEWVCRRWRGEPILLILDDVVNYGAVKPYLDKLKSRFRVLMTTRLQLGTAARCLELPVLAEGAALELLRVLVDDARRIDAQLKDAKELCRWLGYLPLGLELVGRYLAKKPDLSLAKMLGRLQGKNLEARALVKPGEDMTARLGVEAAFELSWEELPQAARVLCGLLGVFALAPIPWRFVEACLPEWEEEELEDCRDEELVGQSLLARVERGGYQLHQLIREFFAAKLVGELKEVSEELQRGVARVMVKVAKQIPQTVTLEVLVPVEEALSHLAEVAQKLTQFLEGIDALWPYNGLARVAQAQSRWPDAEQWCRECLQMAEHRFGPEHPHTATSLNSLAGLYRTTGRYAEAEPLYQRALAMCEAQLGAEHPDTATSLNDLALLYESTGRYAEAEPLFQRALAMCEAQLGAEHPHTASSLNNLAGLYRTTGRYAEAEPLYQRALAIREAQLGAEHPDTATSLNNLAELYRTTGRYAEAEPLYQRALAIWEAQLGAEHPHTASSLNSLAGLYRTTGRYAEAEPLYQRALAIREAQLGAEHPHTASSLNNLAELYRTTGRYAEAEPLLQRALAIWEAQLGAEHPDTATSLNSLAGLYRT
ncbi:MAG: tetratricopeptide repeat protein, partial [Cyanobacteriota bacterium]|nr:tetratricopeptide repeat protein [Cyanobacteriota bacterium]